MADKIQTFDTLFTSNHIKMYKLLLPYLMPDMQKQIAILIKVIEFSYTIDYFSCHPYVYEHTNDTPDGKNLINELLPFCDGIEKKKMQDAANMLHNMENAKEMMETINTIKEMFPEGMEFSEDMDIFNIISQMEGFRGK